MPAAKLTSDQKKEILQGFAQGDRQDSLAQRYGVSARTIKRVIAADREANYSKKVNSSKGPSSQGLLDSSAQVLPDTEDLAAKNAIKTYAVQLLQIEQELELLAPKIIDEIAGSHSQHLKNLVTCKAILLDKHKDVVKEIARLHKDYGIRKPIMPSFKRTVVQLVDVTKEEKPIDIKETG